MTQEEISQLDHLAGSAENMSHALARNVRRVRPMIEDSEIGKPMTQEERDAFRLLARRMRAQAYALSRHAETIDRWTE